MRDVPQHFTVGAGAPLRPVDAVAALIVLQGGRYVMQLRDDRPDIIYPGHWACFGGAMRPGEDPMQALRRELKEELEFELQQAAEFARFVFDVSAGGCGTFSRIYFEVSATLEETERFVLHEGAALRMFEVEALLHYERIAPHDAFAVWLHASRYRIVRPG